MDVLCCGSATVDVFAKTKAGTIVMKTPEAEDQKMIIYPSGSKIIIKEVEFHVGGGGTNTAVAFSRLGFKTAFIGKLGDDNNAKMVLKDLAREKVKFLGQISREGELTGYSIVLDSVAHDRTILAFKGANNSLRFSSKLAKSMKGKALYCSTMVETSLETMKKLIVTAKHNGMWVALNASPYLAKLGIRGLGEILRSTKILIVNREESCLMLGSIPHCHIDPKTMCQELLRAGPEIVVITDGKNGVFASDGTKYYHAQARNVKVIEATGAGDAFGSAFVAGLLKKQRFDICLQMGMHEAESVIQYFGPKNKLLTTREMERALRTFKHKIHISPLYA